MAARAARGAGGARTGDAGRALRAWPRKAEDSKAMGGSFNPVHVYLLVDQGVHLLQSTISRLWLPTAPVSSRTSSPRTRSAARWPGRRCVQSHCDDHAAAALAGPRNAGIARAGAERLAAARAFLNAHVDIPHELGYPSCGISTGAIRRVRTKLDILQGTLDLMVLRTLATLGSLHGYGIARRNRAGQRGPRHSESGDDLHLAGPARAARLDSNEMGRLGKQPPGEVLHHHQGGRETARGRDRELGDGWRR